MSWRVWIDLLEEMDFERVPGEVEQNFEDSFYRGAFFGTFKCSQAFVLWNVASLRQHFIDVWSWFPVPDAVNGFFGGLGALVLLRLVSSRKSRQVWFIFLLQFCWGFRRLEKTWSSPRVRRPLDHAFVEVVQFVMIVLIFSMCVYIYIHIHDI